MEGDRDRLIEIAFAQAGQFSKNLLMHSIKHGPEFGLAGVLRGIKVRHPVRPEESHLLLRDELGVLWPRTSNIA